MNEKKAQIWYTDLMVGISIFVIVILIYYTYAYSLNQEPNDIASDLLMEAKAISSSLLTAGTPSNWNQSNVTIIGLTDGNQRLMQDKLNMFADMNYNESKRKFRTPYDFYFYLEDVNGSRIPIHGKEGIGLNASNAKNIVSITRIAIYNSSLATMVVNIWQ